MSRKPPEEDSERGTLVVDLYGIKLRPGSEDLGEAPPQNWRTVLEQVNRHLMRIAAAPTRLIAETLESATRLIRGLTRLPSAVANRVEKGRAFADARESLRQEQQARRVLTESSTSASAPAALPEASTSPEALAEVEALLEKYRAKGLEAYLVLGPEGRPIIVFGAPPDSDRLVAEVVRRALPEATNDGTG